MLWHVVNTLVVARGSHQLHCTINSAGRGPPGGLHSRKMPLEGASRGEAKYKALGGGGGGGDYGCAQATGR